MANILLLEPGYRNKYPPLGLMKIAAYHRAKGDHIAFTKGIKRDLLSRRWDRVYVTTLFSFEFSRIAKEIDFAIECASGQTRRVFVGGIAASLMTDEFLKEVRWHGVRFIVGLLDKSPAESLQLDQFDGDLYADDLAGEPSIEDYTPDYSILDQIESDYTYPVNDAYFGYASRGCIRKCHFCGVPKLEGGQRDGLPISQLVKNISELYGEKRDLILMDNNVTASTRFKEIIAEIRDAGFEKGAKIQRGEKFLARRVDFNQGVDARILCKDRMFLREMSSICISPLRIAFDHLGLRKPYSQAVLYAREFGITQLSNYMLYNFYDTPSDLFERLKVNIDLNEKLGVRIWSFPMRYQPVDLKDRSHVGPNWTWYWLRSFQLILQATHGVVSGNPEYFGRAFGATQQEFESIMSMPHHMIFNRSYYDFYEGREEKSEYLSLAKRLNNGQRRDLNESLSKITSSKYIELDEEIRLTNDVKVREVLNFFRPLTKEQETSIWASMKSDRKHGDIIASIFPEDQRVEDAGLYEDEPSQASRTISLKQVV